jgi:hypothetical protein
VKPPAYHRGSYPHPGGCEGCRAERVCNACGGAWGRPCTNGRCATCHGLYCTPGGGTTEGHGYGEPPRPVPLGVAALVGACLALCGCAAAPAQPHYGEHPELLCSIYIYRFPAGSLAPDRRAATVIGHTRAPGCAEAAESARHVFLFEEEIR